LIIPQILIFIVSFAAIIWALIQLLLNMRGDSFIVAVNSFWALYNGGLALAIIEYDYKKLFQRRGAFRIPDAIPAIYRVTGSEAEDRRFAVADDITEEGLSLIAIGRFPVGNKLKIYLMLPAVTLKLDCQVVQERTIMAENYPVYYPVCHLGLRFNVVSQDTKNSLSRYLSESAVSKFMREYRIGSKTYVERRFMSEHHYHERAYRSLAYLPVIIRGETGRKVYAVIRDVSKVGLLLASRTLLPQGSEINMDVVLGQQKIALTGIVVRNFFHGSEDYPEYLLGIQISQPSHEKMSYLLALADKIGAFIVR
jgi:hypothetical protein